MSKQAARSHAATAALAGVIIGSLLTFWSQYYLSERAAQRETNRTLEAREIDFITGARIVSAELYGISFSFDSMADQAGLPNRLDVRFALARGLKADDLIKTDAWETRVEVFAQILDRDSWVQIASFYESVKDWEMVIALTPPGQKFTKDEIAYMHSLSDEAAVLGDFVEAGGELDDDDSDMGQPGRGWDDFRQ